MPNVLELFNNKEVLTYLANAPKPQYLGATLFPEEKKDDFEFDVLLGADQTPVLAEVHAFDTESVIRQRQASVQELELLLIKNKIPLKEKELIKLESPRNNAELDYLRKNVYNDMDRMVNGVLSRVEKMRMDVLANGVLSVSENNVTLNIDYGVPATHKETLTTTAWDQAGSDPIGDIIRWAETLQGVGVTPTRALTSTKVVNLLLRNTAVITAVVGTSGRMPTRVELNTFLSSQGLPVIATYDEMYRVLNADGTYTTGRYFPENKFVLMPGDSLGQTLYGPTPEEVRLRRDPSIETNLYGNVTGIVYESNVDPVSTWIKATGLAAPSFPAANYVFQAQVVNP